MDNKIKNYLGFTIIIGVVAFSIAPLPASTIEPGSQEVSISVNLVYEIR